MADDDRKEPFFDDKTGKAIPRDDGRKEPFLADRTPKEPEHVNEAVFANYKKTEQSPDDKAREKMRKEFEERQPKAPPAREAQAKEEPRRHAPTDKAATHTPPTMKRQPTMAGPGGGIIYQNQAAFQAEQAKKAAASTAEMQGPKPEPQRAAEPIRALTPASVNRLVDNKTWEQVREARETPFPVASRHKELAALEAKLSLEDRIKLENRGQAERPGDRLYTRVGLGFER